MSISLAQYHTERLNALRAKARTLPLLEKTLSTEEYKAFLTKLIEDYKAASAAAQSTVDAMLKIQNVSNDS